MYLIYSDVGVAERALQVDLLHVLEAKRKQEEEAAKQKAAAEAKVRTYIYIYIYVSSCHG